MIAFNYIDDKKTLFSINQEMFPGHLSRYEASSLCVFFLFLIQSYKINKNCFENGDIGKMNPIKNLFAFEYNCGYLIIKKNNPPYIQKILISELLKNEDTFYTYLSSTSNIDKDTIKLIDIEMLYQLVVGSFFYNIIKIEDDHIKTKSFRTTVKKNKKNVIKSIKHHPIYKYYLNPVGKNYVRDVEINYIGRTSTERALDILNHKDNNCFLESSYIIVLGDSSYLLDGAHRVALFRKNYGRNYLVKVKRFYINNFNIPRGDKVIRRIMMKVRRIYGRGIKSH